MRCPECKASDQTTTRCTVCGHSPLSVGSDSLDELVEAASVPNLAALFGAAKKAGHISTTMPDYGHTVA